jgi:hypothetical protein
LARATERPRGNSASPACGLQNLFISRRQDVEFPAEHSRVTNHSTAPCYLVFLLWSDPAATQHENGTSLWKTWIFLEIARSSKFHFQQDMISDVTPIDARKRVCHSMLERQSKLRLLLTPKGLPAWATEKPNKQTKKERNKQTKKMICRTCTRAIWCTWIYIYISYPPEKASSFCGFGRLAVFQLD